MRQTDLSRYLTYSLLLHFTFLGWVLFINLSKKKGKTYYAVDFVSGLPAGGARSVPETPKEETIKTQTVNPEEDLLLKSKKKKNVKDVVTKAPPVPTLDVPKALPRKDAQVGEVPGAIPDAGSGGIGIGFGDGIGSGSGGAGNFPYAWYVQTIKKKLDSNWNVEGGFSTRIYTQVGFTITRDGSLVDVEVEETSKNEVFDRAALRAVQSSAPLPPLPSGFDEPALRVHVRFTVKR